MDFHNATAIMSGIRLVIGTLPSGAARCDPEIVVGNLGTADSAIELGLYRYKVVP